MPAILLDGKLITFRVEGSSILVDGREIVFTVLGESDGRLIVKIGNAVREIFYVEGDGQMLMMTGDGPRKMEILGDRDLLMRSLNSGGAAHRAHSEIRAPMPGLVVKILAEEGDSLKRGGKLLILEAMKMENEIRVPVDAVVDKILVHGGDIVEKDQVIATLR